MTRDYRNSRFKNIEHFHSVVPAVSKLTAESAPLSRRFEVREKFSLIKPTQSEFGRLLVEANVSRQAKRANDQGMTKHELVLGRGSGYAVPAVLDHLGQVYVLDSHHGIWTNLILLEESKEDPYILLKILKDFRGQSLEAFIGGVFGPASEGGLEKGQYVRELRNASLLEKFKSLPTSFADMKDNPHRSLVGAALSNYGVQADNLKDYVEFTIIDELLDLDLIPNTNLLFNKFNIHAYAKVIYQGQMFDFMQTTLRKENKRTDFEAQLKKANALFAAESK